MLTLCLATEQTPVWVFWCLLIWNIIQTKATLLFTSAKSVASCTKTRWQMTTASWSSQKLPTKHTTKIWQIKIFVALNKKI